MIKSVVREHKWIPEVIDKLFLDDYDHRGLLYWYNDIDEVNKELKKKSKK